MKNPIKASSGMRKFASEAAYMVLQIAPKLKSQNLTECFWADDTKDMGEQIHGKKGWVTVVDSDGELNAFVVLTRRVSTTIGGKKVTKNVSVVLTRRNIKDKTDAEALPKAQVILLNINFLHKWSVLALTKLILHETTHVLDPKLSSIDSTNLWKTNKAYYKYKKDRPTKYMSLPHEIDAWAGEAAHSIHVLLENAFLKDGPKGLAEQKEIVGEILKNMPFILINKTAMQSWKRSGHYKRVLKYLYETIRDFKPDKWLKGKKRFVSARKKCRTTFGLSNG